MKKKIVWMLFVLCMALLVFPCQASADDYPTSGTCGENLTWELKGAEDGDGGYIYTLMIRGTGNMTSGGSSYGQKWYWARGSIAHIVIEDGVTGIVGLGGALVESVTIPDSVVTIDGAAFANCRSLTDITIPDSVTVIGNNAFAGCESLTNITIPDSVTAIWSGAFYNCTSLKEVTIPESVTEIQYYYKGKGMFEGCSSLTRVEIKNGLAEIGLQMFKDCSSLTEIVIPNSVRNIGREAFRDCSSLSNITIPESVESIGGYYGSDSEVYYGAFWGCSSLTSITIPGSVTGIGKWAFGGCTNLERVDFSNSTAAITGETFLNCENLSELSVNPENPLYCSENGVLFSKNKKKLICFPQGRAGSYQIPNSVTAIGEYAFYGCSGLEYVTIPDSVTSMGTGAFQQCGLMEIEIPGSINYISYYAFTYCKNLASVVIQNGVETIGTGAFDDCAGLTSVVIPDGVRWIYSGAFESCSNIASVTIPSSVQRIEYDAFTYCKKLTDVYYAKGEADWKSITKAYIGFSEKNVTMHYNSRGDFSVFQSPSTNYDNRLALIAADMSEKAEGGEDALRELYDSYGLTECEYYNFDGSAAFAIGQTAFTIDSVDTTVLVITARGTKNLAEAVGDLFKGEEVDFLGKRVWQNVHEFYQKIRNGLDDYVEKHPAIKTKEHLKIFVNGHSLGGAAANMVGARLTYDEGMSGDMWHQHIEKEDIYVYTFGAIKVLNDLYEYKNVSDGYENIHNIYNFYDSYGPNGNWSWTNASAMRAKFGHTELYYLKYDEVMASCNNHLMSNYKQALEQNKVSCSKKAQEKSKERIEKLEQYLSGIWTNISRRISQISVLCPVDVEIYASDGSLAGSIIDNEAGETSSNKIYFCTEGDKKYIYFLDDDNYTIRLKGTDSGTMTYSVQNIDMDTGEIIEEKTFVNVALTDGKAFASSVKVEKNIVTEIAKDAVRLFVVKENGEPEKEVLADGNGTETAVSKTPDGQISTNKQPDEKNPNGTALVKVEKIKISGLSNKIAAGKKIALKAEVSPSNATDQSVTWESDNQKYATVNDSGVVTLKKAGKGRTVTITAAAKDGSGEKASYRIKIMKGIVKKVTIAGKAIRTAKSETSVKLKASVKASNGANKALQWKSSNDKYASVDGKGKVALKKEGKGKTVKITAMATDGSGKKAVVKIKIN